MNDASPYPRDFRGYGGNPPDPQWPGNARVAVSLVVNVKAGSELSLADGDERNESVHEIVEPLESVPNLLSRIPNGPTTARPVNRRSLTGKSGHASETILPFFTHPVTLNARNE